MTLPDDVGNDISLLLHIAPDIGQMASDIAVSMENYAFEVLEALWIYSHGSASQRLRDMSTHRAMSLAKLWTARNIASDVARGLTDIATDVL